MFRQQFAAFCLLIAGISCHMMSHYGHGYDDSNECNPPDNLIGVFCTALRYNDFDQDGDVDNKDFDHDLILYHFDDDLCNLERWEVVKGWTCRYGYSEAYGNYTFTTWDFNGDGVVNAADFGPIVIPARDFLVFQFTNFRDNWCRHDRYIDNPIDQKLCAEAETLTEDAIQCDSQRM